MCIEHTMLVHLPPRIKIFFLVFSNFILNGLPSLITFTFIYVCRNPAVQFQLSGPCL